MMVLNKTLKTIYGKCIDMKRKQYLITEVKLYVTALLRTFVSRGFKLSCKNKISSFQS